MNEQQYKELAISCGATHYYVFSTTFETDKPSGVSFTNKQFQEFCKQLKEVTKGE